MLRVLTTLDLAAPEQDVDAQDKRPDRQDEIHPVAHCGSEQEDHPGHEPHDREPSGTSPMRMPMVVVEKMKMAAILMA